MSEGYSLEEFSDGFRGESSTIIFLYCVYHDLTIKNEMDELKVMNGHAVKSDYPVIEGINKKTRARQIFIPISAEAEIDLQWCVDFTLRTETIYSFIKI